MRSYKYRLYPTKQQQAQLQWTLDRCRELYNAALQERKEAYKYTRRSISFAEQCRDITVIRNEIREEYQQIGSHVLQNVLHRVDKAYKAFFRRVKAGQTPGYPRFQGRNRYDSFCFPDHDNWKLITNRLAITNLGSIKVKLHREVKGTIKTCTVKREGEHWYVVFACEVELEQHLPYSDEMVGIDLGVSKLATLSNGDEIANPRHVRKGAKKLEQAQQALSRKKRGSNRRKKAVQVVARIHRKTRNQRADYLHKQSRWLVDSYETIVFEALQPKNMTRRPKPKQDEDGKYLPNGASAKAGLNKSILDAGWSQFVQYVTYKVEETGGSVLFVNPFKTSQWCSGCGVEVKKDLAERWHSCECGVELDRDHNAAINIRKLGQRLQEQSC